MGRVSDKGCLICLVAYRELIEKRYLQALLWAPTDSMLCDEMTKDMGDTPTWQEFYGHGFWGPKSSPHLPEDCVLYEDGVTARYRVLECGS